jgi:hypothetical protein
VITKPRKNEEAKALYRDVENTNTMGCNARKKETRITFRLYQSYNTAQKPWTLGKFKSLLQFVEIGRT